MTQLPSGAIGVAGKQNPRTGSSANVLEFKLPLKIPHREEGYGFPGFDPSPAGFDFKLLDDDPGAEALRALLSRDFTGQKA
jgi:hypothetical protein